MRTNWITFLLIVAAGTGNTTEFGLARYLNDTPANFLVSGAKTGTRKGLHRKVCSGNSTHSTSDTKINALMENTCSEYTKGTPVSSGKIESATMMLSISPPNTVIDCNACHRMSSPS